MINWYPKIEENLQGANQKELFKKRIILTGILILGFFIAVIIGTPYFEVILAMAILFSIIMYIKWRKLFISTYTKNYHDNKNKNVINDYFKKFYLDYSWKDSLVIASIFILGVIAICLVIYYLTITKP